MPLFRRESKKESSKVANAASVKNSPAQSPVSSPVVPASVASNSNINLVPVKSSTSIQSAASEHSTVDKLHRSSSVSQKFKHLFSHDHNSNNSDNDEGSLRRANSTSSIPKAYQLPSYNNPQPLPIPDRTQGQGRPTLSINSNSNSNSDPNSPSSFTNKNSATSNPNSPSNLELNNSLNKLKLMEPVVENDLDELLDIPDKETQLKIKEIQQHQHSIQSQPLSQLQSQSQLTSQSSRTIPKTNISTDTNTKLSASNSNKSSPGLPTSDANDINAGSSTSSLSSVNSLSNTHNTVNNSNLRSGRGSSLISKLIPGHTSVNNNNNNNSNSVLQPPPKAHSNTISSKIPEDYLMPSEYSSRSDSSASNNSNRQRSTSVSIATPYENSNLSNNQNSGFFNPLKHAQSVSYSATHLHNQRETILKLKNGRLMISTDGRTHEHDYNKYKTQPVKSNASLFSWMKKKDPNDSAFGSIENSISLLPDSYSKQLMELKRDPKNFRWNYEDSDDGDDEKDDGDDDDDGDDGDDDDEDEDGEDDFDDEADDELIEPIIGKDQLYLINSMMDKIEHPNKFKEKIKVNKVQKLTLTEKYGVIEGIVGKGSYGTVCISSKTIGTNKKNKVFYAIKQLKQRPHESLHHFGNRVTSEFMISSSLTHQAIINVYDLMVDPVSMTYSQIMEFIPCGDLFSLISVTNGLEVIECDCFFKQILNAITYLHSVGISHNDLKVENLLLTRKGQLKIIDFGTSAVFKTAWEDKVQFSKGACGSERYVAPEQYNQEKEYDPRLGDVWSLGIIYLVMFYGNYAWEAAKKSDEHYVRFLETRATFDYSQKSTTIPKQFLQTRKGSFNQIESISSGAYPNSRRYVLYNILNPDPKFRMRTYQIWRSDWIKNFIVCDAGRGFVSYDNYIEMALQNANVEEQRNKSPV